MLKNLFFLSILSLSVVFQSCNKYEETETGLKYKLVNDSAGANAQMGDMLVVHLKFENEKDTLDTYKRGAPISIFLQPSFKGSLEEGLTYASKGDSISIQVSNDSLYTKIFGNDSLPKEIKAGSYSTFNIRVVDHYTKDRLAKEQSERSKQMTQQKIAFMSQVKKEILDSAKAQFKIDEPKIQAYLKKNKLNAQRTENGVYYVVNTPGSGPAPVAGDTVVLQYVGKLLDGKQFDASKPEKPFVFQLGTGSVIPGFDEALLQLNKGSKATVVIPSPFAYGEQGIRASETDYVIPPHSPLVFDLEVVDVKKTK